MKRIATAVATFLFCGTAAVAHAADIHVMISAGFFGVYAELVPEFEKATGHHVLTVRGPSLGDSPEAIPARLGRGEPADLVILDGASADELAKRGLVKGDTKVTLAKSLIGMVVREGAPKPDISTVDAFKKTVLAAKSLAWSDSGSGTYMSTKMFQQLGIADQILPKGRKVRGPPSGEPVANVIARGEAEIGFQQVSELIHTKGVTFVGALPAELQPGFTFAGVVAAKAKEEAAAKELIAYLASPSTAAVKERMGLAPADEAKR